MSWTSYLLLHAVIPVTIVSGNSKDHVVKMILPKPSF